MLTAFRKKKDELMGYVEKNLYITCVIEILVNENLYGNVSVFVKGI